LFDLVRKNMYIPTGNIVGLTTRDMVHDLWYSHQSPAQACGRRHHSHPGMADRNNVGQGCADRRHGGGLCCRSGSRRHWEKRSSAPLAGDGGTVTVLTVIEVPRALLQELQGHFSDQQPPTLHMTDSETVSTTDPAKPRSWPGDDAIIEQYLEDKKNERCQPVVEVLRAGGVSAGNKVVEGPAARGILDTAKDLDVDVIIVGSHGVGLFEGLLGSTGTKVTRLAKRLVLVLRTD
jgi:nucleotide-binding universal stress UspA family protein